MIPFLEVLISTQDQSYRLLHRKGFYHLKKKKKNQVWKRLDHLLNADYEIYASPLRLESGFKFLVIAEETVVITIISVCVRGNNDDDNGDELMKCVLSLNSRTMHWQYFR